jgi:hypothetical protein
MKTVEISAFLAMPIKFMTPLNQFETVFHVGYGTQSKKETVL